MIPDGDSFGRGIEFLEREGRLLERRLAATCFGGAPAAAVVDVLRGYQNEDGGFGYGLEPDTRCPASLPIYVESALQALVTARTSDATMLTRATDFLARTAAEADAGGAVPLAFPIIESYPRAAHWTDWTYQPGLNPTAGLTGLLLALGVDHRFVADASEYCWAQLEQGAFGSNVHTLSEVFVFLDHTPDRERADAVTAQTADALRTANMFLLDASATGYGLTPLHIAQSPTSRWRALFTDGEIDAHLDRLQEQQRSDGGWPITWEPPSELATLEWRGIETLRALRALVSYGRIVASV